jgi:hypothetical protein
MATGEAPTREAQRGSEAVRQSLLPLFRVLAALRHAALAMAGGCYGSRSPPSRYFVGLGIYSGDVLRDPAFELNCLLTRSVYSWSWRSSWAISAPTKGRYASRSPRGGANGDHGGQAAPRARPPHRMSGPRKTRRTETRHHKKSFGDQRQCGYLWAPFGTPGLSFAPSHSVLPHREGEILLRRGAASVERVRKPTTLPTTLIAWGAVPFVLAAPALDARGSSAEQGVRIPITGQLRLVRSAVWAVPGVDSPRFGV